VPPAPRQRRLLEVQFYPDALVRNCTPNGGFVVSYAPNTYTVCSPVWSIHTTGQKPVFHEPAAFNAMLTTGSKHQPLVMHAGDTIDLHFHVVSPNEGWHIDVTDEATRQSGTIVLNSPDGPLLPAFDKQEIGNALGWGLVNDTPNSFVWEIGHTSPFTSPPAQFCVPGRMGGNVVDPDQVGHLRRRFATNCVGHRLGHGRPGRGARQLVRRSDGLLQLWRPVLHLSVVLARIERVPLRR
jgi:hypothetical protein